jgi:predicted nucleic acid-binding Zn finger protein
MAGPALAYEYRYQHPSTLEAMPSGARLRLATFGGQGEAHPHFFEGRLVHPGRAAELLRSLVDVVQSRFYLPAAMLARVRGLLADPVVTGNGELLRFEGFSGCCSTYGRVDLLPDAIDGTWHGRGTSNVDFNAPMRAALAQVRASDDVGLAVGGDDVRLTRAGESIVERKVALPVRWLKGFVEVQAYQARMVRKIEVSGFDALRFLRSLPKGQATTAGWVVASGRGLRLSQVPARGGVRVGGVERLHILDILARQAKSLVIYADDQNDASAWELVLGEARFTLTLSPDASRGFSGEGQVLTELAERRFEKALPRVRASLHWDSRIKVDSLAESCQFDRKEVTAALAALAARGVVGYDLAEGAYFHRELPFDLNLVEALQPRLRDARELVKSGGVRIEKRERDSVRIDAAVRGTDVEHIVRIGPDGERCSCPWYAKHQNARGPCKHILAVQITLEADGEDTR